MEYIDRRIQNMQTKQTADTKVIMLKENINMFELQQNTQLIDTVVVILKMCAMVLI